MILSQHTRVSLSGSSKADAEPFIRLCLTGTGELNLDISTEFTLEQFDTFIEQCKEQRDHAVEMKRSHDRERQIRTADLGVDVRISKQTGGAYADPHQVIESELAQIKAMRNLAP